MTDPFPIENDNAYRKWRDWKLGNCAASINELIVDIQDPKKLSSAEHSRIALLCKTYNMAIYAGKKANADSVRELGRQFGLVNLDANWLADDDGISQIKISGGERQAYIPYTNKAIKWHTDGYYNDPDRRIRAMVLHCARNAYEGGENSLMDHEIAYILLRDENPQHIRALMMPDAMTIPAREDENGIARAAQTGSVFSVDSGGKLHMRYTARTRSIQWKSDEATKAAVACLEKILSSASEHIYKVKLEPGMGILCNNVLHDRSSFTQDTDNPRLLYRARYYDRILGT